MRLATSSHAPHLERIPCRHPSARDGCRARTAIGLKDVAVDRHRDFTAHAAHIADVAQRTPDQALDFLAAAFAALGFARSALGARGREKHGVFGREPA